MKLNAFFASLFVLALIGCNEKSGNQDSDQKNIKVKDLHSYSNIDEISTKHINLDLVVDFKSKTVSGVARHQMENTGVITAIFDVKGLNIKKITLGQKDEKETSFTVGTEDALIGSALTVDVEKTTEYINIYYSTSPDSEALDWLPASITDSKKFPFMYSQGQAVLTRSWIPTQDTPANRITYSANIKVPEGITCVMGARLVSAKSKEGIYKFEMDQPIPCYLIAIAAGDLAYAKLGNKCGVYAEPGLLDACRSEFADLPSMMSAAEKLFGEYKWEEYDVIVLPYSFPYGGMENPRLTFANPTLIAGDKSLVSVIAHELAHSWSGNLVTNSTWNDFWLNEGFTVYIENRIMEEISGKEVANMLALIEFQELETELKEISAGPHPEDTQLKLDLGDRSPDDAMTSVAYVKGAFFLKTLESVVGREDFDKFLSQYFKDFSFKTISTKQFEAYLNENLLNPKNISFNTKEWLYEKNLPSNCIRLESVKFETMQNMASEYANGNDLITKNKIKRSDKITQEWLAFIRTLPVTLTYEQMKGIDDRLNFKGCGNAEIMAEWYVLSIRNGYKDIRPEMEKFLMKVGRRKFLSPIYRTLASSTDDKLWAEEVFSRARSNYHSVSINTIQEYLR
ncbi:MAG: leukotriene-A4 hydrolase [Psychromonas sp.]|jgi:leukotriene-A4 hydrolase